MNDGYYVSRTAHIIKEVSRIQKEYITLDPLNKQYKKLAVAIVDQAIKDFGEDLKYPCSSQAKLKMLLHWKKWFTSQWFGILMESDGLAIYNQVLYNFERHGGVYQKTTYMHYNKAVGKKGITKYDEDEVMV